MLTTEQRAAVVKEALTWVGTPYRGHSCVKGAGTDCGQLLYGIFRALQLVPEVVLPKDYSLQVALHQVSTEYVDFIRRFMREIPEALVSPGDVVVYELGLSYAHGALVLEWPGFVIQAEARHGVSGSHGTRTPLFRRATRLFFTLKDEYCGGGF